MNKKLLLVLASLMLCVSAQAAMVTVQAADFATFSRDVDGDGTDDFTSLALYSTTQVRLMASFDMLLSTATVPGLAGAGSSKYTLGFPDADVGSEDIWEGTWNTGTYAAGDRWSNVSSMYITDYDNPIHIGWSLGTKGSGTSAVSLIGLVIDAQNWNYAASTGSVDVYWNYYGDFDAASGDQTVSLADTGFEAVPEPATAGLLTISGLLLFGIRRLKKTYGIR